MISKYAENSAVLNIKGITCVQDIAEAMFSFHAQEGGYGAIIDLLAVRGQDQYATYKWGHDSLYRRYTGEWEDGWRNKSSLDVEIMMDTMENEEVVTDCFFTLRYQGGVELRFDTSNYFEFYRYPTTGRRYVDNWTDALCAVLRPEGDVTDNHVGYRDAVYSPVHTGGSRAFSLADCRQAEALLPDEWSLRACRAWWDYGTRDEYDEALCVHNADDDTVDYLWWSTGGWHNNKKKYWASQSPIPRYWDKRLDTIMVYGNADALCFESFSEAFEYIIGRAKMP